MYGQTQQIAPIVKGLLVGSLAIPMQLFHKNGDELRRFAPARAVSPVKGSQKVPSLIRFLVFCGVLAGLVYGGMFALATFVEPQEREMRVKIPSKKLNP